MRKQKRTNFSEKIFNFIFKAVLPVLLAFSFIAGESIKTLAGKLLYTSAAITSPRDAVSIIKKDTRNTAPKTESASGEIYKNNKPDYSSSSSSLQAEFPDDIAQLIKEAETKYANSTNDGAIKEIDYYGKNATAEFDGVFVRNTTKNHSVNIEEYLNKKVQAAVSDDGPCVLIYHTHTTEAYELLDRGFYTNSRSARSENSAENMVRVGDEICRVLEKNGYKTIHDKTVYDKEYNGAYDRSRASITEIIKNNPSIQIAIDVHRDAIYQKDGTRIKPVVEINGRKAAQIMLISGCEDGNVTNFPNWQKNMAFAVQLQKQISSANPKLMRPIMFCSRKYNMDLMSCSLVAEIGSDANTLAEAVYSAELFAESLSEFLKEFKI